MIVTYFRFYIKLKWKIKTCVDDCRFVKITGLKTSINVEQLVVEVVEIETQKDITDVTGRDDSAKFYLKIFLWPSCQLKLKIARARIVDNIGINIAKITF